MRGIRDIKGGIVYCSALTQNGSAGLLMGCRRGLATASERGSKRLICQQKLAAAPLDDKQAIAAYQRFESR